MSLLVWLVWLTQWSSVPSLCFMAEQYISIRSLVHIFFPTVSFLESLLLCVGLYYGCVLFKTLQNKYFSFVPTKKVFLTMAFCQNRAGFTVLTRRPPTNLSQVPECAALYPTALPQPFCMPATYLKVAIEENSRLWAIWI